ncbi:MAG: holo-ACP synthase [Defluviitaleaceae bacterium]|nr:holo-ACP synthase [Defluviitaleaceae bacterium]
MILGIGIDLIEIERIERAAAKPSFLSSVFTQNEIAEFERRGRNFAILAGTFAGKEAVVKALGTGFRGFRPNSVEILRDELGKPKAVLYGTPKEIADNLGIQKWHITLTNTADTAAAFVIAEKYDQ